MSIQNPIFESGSDGAPSSFDASSQIMHLLAGLERQKEELGPIAVELIELLHRLGVATPPQVDR